MRTPLTAINEASALLAEGRFQGRSGQHQELLTIIRNECTRLTRSTNNLLDLSRIEAGMMTFRFQPGDLGELVYGCVQRLAPIAQRGGIDLIEQRPPELPPIRFDHRHIDQALENIIGNALKFTPRGGQIQVAVTLDRPGFAAVAVSDSGPGISAEHLERIFDKFKRIDNGDDSIYGSRWSICCQTYYLRAQRKHMGRKSTGTRRAFRLYTTIGLMVLLGIFLSATADAQKNEPQSGAVS